MGRKAIDILEDFLKTLQKRRVEKLSEEKLDRLIKAFLGADPRTVKKYKQLLEEFGMIQRTKDGKIKINYNWNII